MHRLLTSPTIRVTVAGSKVFLLHSGLLTQESDRFAKSLNGRFTEAEDAAIDLKDEDPALFGFFVEYMYRGCHISMDGEQSHSSDCIILARLYAMGERLQAVKFQYSIAGQFVLALDNRDYIGDVCICQLLTIACMEITERAEEDRVRQHIFKHAIRWMGRLRTSGLFRQTLKELEEAQSLPPALLESISNPPALPILISYPTPEDEARKRWADAAFKEEAARFEPENEYDT